MSESTAPLSVTVATESQQKRHWPIFLAVFTVFLFSSTFFAAVNLKGIWTPLAQHDTLWFWESGHLLLHDRNPYDRETFRQFETAMGLHLKGADVLMTLNPPFSMAIFLPLGIIPASHAAAVWSLFLALCLGVSVWAIQRAAGLHHYCGYLWLAWFLPSSLFCIRDGQTGLIVLLGLALFIRYCETNPLCAGAALSLCALKPHLLIPFSAVVLAWTITRKRWSLFAGAALALAIESLIAIAFDHAIWSQYRTMVRTEPFTEKMIPTLGVVFRLLIDRRALWLEFVPAMGASIWAIWYFLRNRQRWNWRDHGSPVTLVSLIVAPYAWITDHVIVIPAMLFALLSAKRLRRGSLTLLLVVIVAREAEAIITKSIFDKADIATDTVLSLLWLGWYLFATRTNDATASESPQHAAH